MDNNVSNQNMDLKSVMRDKLKSFLGECSLAESHGLTFSGEAWAYKRMLKFIDSLNVSAATPTAQ